MSLRTGSVAAHLLSEWDALSGSESGEVLMAAADPSHVVGHPSAVLRNALLLAAVRWRVPRLRVVAVRERGGRADVTASQLFDVALPSVPPGEHLASQQHAVQQTRAVARCYMAPLDKKKLHLWPHLSLCLGDL